MERQNTIVVYESVAEVMKQMLHAARMQDWDRLTELEQSCAQQVETLKSMEESSIQPLSSEFQRRKVATIKSILADDREIRNLVSPWMVRLSALMSSNHKEQRLAQAYRR